MQFKEISYTEHPTNCYVDFMKESLKPYQSLLPTRHDNITLNPQISRLNQAFPQNLSTSEIRQNIVTFNVYFKDLTYNLISDTPQINWFSLFANLAGICGGSFLGMSFLAILEFLEYFFYLFFIVFKFGFIEIISLFRRRKEIKL